MAFGDANQFVPSSAKTASGNSGAIACEKGLNLNLLIDATAVSGTTPTLALGVEWSADGVNFAVVDTTADSFAQITAATKVVKQFAAKMPFFRLVWTIGGTTPSFTFGAWKYITE